MGVRDTTLPCPKFRLEFDPLYLLNALCLPSLVYINYSCIHRSQFIIEG